MKRTTILAAAVVALFPSISLAGDAGDAGDDRAGAAPDYARDISPIFRKYCNGCHNTSDREGELVLTSYETLQKGGENGPAVVPGKSAESRLMKLVERKEEPFMPPGKRRGPSNDEIEALRAWIDAGAKGPASAAAPAASAVAAIPKVLPTVPPRIGVQSVACDPRGRWIALGRHGEAELLSALHRERVAGFAGHPAAVNAVSFSANGDWLVAAGGEPGLSGEARLYDVATGALLGTFGGHGDSLYAAVLSPDEKLLATAGYDQEIKLWSVETGAELRALRGHNAAVYDLAFRADGKILASASGDRTVKIWDVASGARLDTFSQPLKDIHTVAFSPDGTRVAAGGADNRIRIWRVSASAAEGTNELLISRFAHEGAILKLVFSPDGRSILSSADDRTVKLWDVAPMAGSMTERRIFERQSDWAPALSFTADGKMAVVGRLDGSLGFYSVETGNPVRVAAAGGTKSASLGLVALFLASLSIGSPEEKPQEEKKETPKPPKPELTSIEPRGVQRGVPSRVKLAGKNLAGATGLKVHGSGVTGTLVPATQGASQKPDDLLVEISTAPDAALGAHEIAVVTPAGESGKIKFFVDTLAQFAEREASDGSSGAVSSGAAEPAGALPLGMWGTIETPGDIDRFAFEARAGQTVVLDLAAAALGSKLNGVLTILDGATGEVGRALAATNDHEGAADPLLAFTVPETGRYVVQVSDLMQGGSKDHFYRLTMGTFPFVTGIHPLGVAAKSETDVELIGFNLPQRARVKIHADGPGERDVPLDPERFRARRGFKVIVGEGSEAVETEPNDRPEDATALQPPAAVSGRIRSSAGRPDADLFRFDAKEGQVWIIETDAARRGSPIDTRIEVLDAGGRPVERAILQAVRDSWITFRPIDAGSAEARVGNWEEMELNQFLYMQGEVAKLFRAPQGPDSAFIFYTSAGRRRCYFDTSGTRHALDEPCYIVEPQPPGKQLVSTGLPVFPIHYENDDDGERRLGRDSRIAFSAPQSGAYLVRVTDVHGQGGDGFTYRLVVREAKPDFHVTLHGANPTVAAGSGRSFTVSVDRIDGFEGDVRIDITGLPAGFGVSSPIVIEAGHSEAKGTVNAAADAVQPSAESAKAVKVTAAAVFAGRTESVIKDVNSFGLIQLGPKPKMTVRLEPMPGADGKTGPLELTIAPGSRAPAMLRVDRSGHDDLVTFQVENLPHGVIVDDIGLSGVLIPAGQSERQIFLNAARWVPETSRPCHAIESQAGGQTSRPVLLHVRRQ